MPWLGIRGNGTLSHALPRKFRLEAVAPAISGYEDEARLRTVGLEHRGLRTNNMRAFGYWGNDRIAFVPMLGTFESDTSLGTTRLLLVFRKAADQWKLLT